MKTNGGAATYPWSSHWALPALSVVLAFGLNAHASDLRKLESDLSSDNGQVVLGALKELKALGPAGSPAVPAIVELLKKKKNYPWSDYGLDNVVYPAAFETLKATGAKSDAVLLVSLDYFKNASEHLGVKSYALDLIADYGEKAAPVVPLLAAQLETGRMRVADLRRILNALERIGPSAAPATVSALVKIVSNAPLGSDRMQALSALNKIAPTDPRVLKAYADAAWKRPGNSEDEKIYGLFSDYLSKYGKLNRDDLAILAGYMDHFTKREAAEDRNPRGHVMSTNPNYLFVAKLFLDYPGSAGLIMPSLAERIRQMDMHMKDFKLLLELAGGFGAQADPLVAAIEERASSRERIMFGFLQPLALKTLNEIGTASAKDAAKRLSRRR